MKDYLKEKLSKEEELVLYAIIWNNSRLYKERIYQKKKITYELIDNIDKQVEDTYTFYTSKSQEAIVPFRTLNDKQKCDIVMDLDSLLRELCLFELIGTLTFNEKLVFFLFYVEDFRNGEIAKLLNNTEKTILNRRKSIDKKIDKMKGDLKYGEIF